MVRLTCFLILLLFSSSYLYANETPLTWGYINFKPYHFNENGRVEGTIADLVRKIFTNANLKYTSFELPNKRAKLYLDQGKVDFTIVIESFAKDSDNYLRTKLPFYKITLGAICLKDSLNINSIESLKGLKLIILAGYTYGLEQKISNEHGFDIVLEAQNHKSAFEALMYKRADCALGYKEPFLTEKNNHLDTTFYFNQITELPVYLFLRAQATNAEVIIQQIDKSIQSNQLRSQ